MDKVDPMEIMLSDIFNKVFYNEDRGPSREVCGECIGEGVIQRDEGDIDLTFVTCEDCDGVGWVETEYARPQNFDRDIGCKDTRRVDCETCHGNGEVEIDDG